MFPELVPKILQKLGYFWISRSTRWLMPLKQWRPMLSPWRRRKRCSLDHPS